MNHNQTKPGLIVTFFRKLHGMPVDQPHSHSQGHTHPESGSDTEGVLHTDGATISWAFLYDIIVSLLFGGQEKQYREAIIRLANIQPGEKVLDVGCGTGKMALAAQKKAPTAKIYGRDASPEMIARAQQGAAKAKANVDFRLGLVEAIDFPDNSLDLVLSNFMVHHLPDSLKVKAFAEIYRVLKPGGRLQITEFEPPRKGLKMHILNRAIPGMMQIDTHQIPPLLTQAGFTDVSLGSSGHPMATVVTGKKSA
ncbi:MAG TPA: methyltransferase domain-containing protein [Anaerolineales bacterium]|nr:methyltransferase domain-containing protein [Anaerolineales bacterium]